MATVMSLPQVDQYLSQVAQMGKWGWLPQHRKIAKYIRTKTKKRLKAHVSPTGTPWAPRFIPKYKFRVGRPGPVRESSSAFQKRHGGYIWAYLHSPRQVRRANRFGKKMVRALYGSNKKALYRAGKHKGKRARATKLFTALTKDRAPGSATRFGRDHFQYGLSPAWSRWAGVLHSGGTWKGKLVPARPMLGLTQTDVDFILKVYADAIKKRLRKLVA